MEETLQQIWAKRTVSDQKSGQTMKAWCAEQWRTCNKQNIPPQNGSLLLISCKFYKYFTNFLVGITNIYHIMHCLFCLFLFSPL